MKKLLAAALLAAPLYAEGMGSLHASFGWGQVTQMYDTAGTAQDLGQDASLQVLNLHLRGSYNVLSLPTQSVFVGGGLALQQRSYSQTVSGQSFDKSSGFALQAFTVFAGLRGPLYMAKLGFSADLGPKAEAADEMENSDRQHDIFLKASVWLPNPMFALSGHLAYHFTLARSEEVVNVTVDVDNGDWFEIGAKGGYKFPMGEAGLVLNYILKTAASSDGNTVDNTDAYLITVYPYVKISPPMSPVSFTLKLAAMEEYAYYGFSLAGKNAPVTRLGFTLGAMMSL